MELITRPFRPTASSHSFLSEIVETYLVSGYNSSYLLQVDKRKILILSIFNLTYIKVIWHTQASVRVHLYFLDIK